MASSTSFVAVTDLVYIQRTLLAILVTMIGFFLMRVFKRNDSTEALVSEIAKAVQRLEGTVTYIERTSVKKEDLIELIRREIQYSEE